MGSRRRRGARSLAGSGKTGVPFTGRERERRRWLQQTVMQFALDVAWLWCSREGPPLPPHPPPLELTVGGQEFIAAPSSCKTSAIYKGNSPSEVSCW